MEETYRILNRVGLALCIVGVVDIAVFIYGINNDINYTSSFNIFAVLAGLFLIKGNIHVARIVTLFSAFLLAAFIGLFFTFPLLEPIKLQLIDYKLNPVSKQISIFFMLSATGFIYWIYRQLSCEPVMLARKQAGLSYGFPKQAFALGIILVVGLAFSMNKLRNSENANVAKIKASEIYGEEYEYHVTHINNTANHFHVRLTAYNEFEIRKVDVEWRN